MPHLFLPCTSARTNNTYF